MTPEVGIGEDVEVMFRIEKRSGDRGADKANHQRACYGGVGERHGAAVVEFAQELVSFGGMSTACFREHRGASRDAGGPGRT